MSGNKIQVNFYLSTIFKFRDYYPFYPQFWKVHCTRHSGRCPHSSLLHKIWEPILVWRAIISELSQPHLHTATKKTWRNVLIRSKININMPTQEPLITKTWITDMNILNLISPVSLLCTRSNFQCSLKLEAPHLNCFSLSFHDCEIMGNLENLRYFYQMDKLIIIL